MKYKKKITIIYIYIGHNFQEPFYIHDCTHVKTAKLKTRIKILNWQDYFKPKMNNIFNFAAPGWFGLSSEAVNTPTMSETCQEKGQA